MPSLTMIVPGSLATLTGGYGYDRRIVAGLRDRGWAVAVREIDGSFPRPTVAALEGARRALEAAADGATVLVDGLAFGAMPEVAERHARRLRLVALVHHPLATETGIDAATAIELKESERRALAAACHVIVTSHATLEALGSYGVDRRRVTVVEPGTDRAPLASGSRNGFVQLLCVASLTPRKGHEVLFRALAAISHRNWRLTCVGSPHRDPALAERLRRQLRDDGLDGRVELVGEEEGEALAARYDRADLFVLPTLHEGYGMVVAEALARGLPVVSTATGAIPELVAGNAGDGHQGSGTAAAGHVVAPGDVDALAAALTDALGSSPDGGRLREFAEGARRVRDRLPTWEVASARIAEALERAAAGG